jgi:GDP/UDP-N,N'-diacetylbacillosamine 2-epimerase (hydrolysing)
MQSTLRALRDHPAIELQLIATGLHAQPLHRAMREEIGRAGWEIDALVPWDQDASPVGIARAMGLATASLADQFDARNSEVVLIVGDRVEAFAAASAAYVSGRIVAHVHGGDRAMGQVDDTLRHAISKLAHVHFCATQESGDRLFRMGEDRKRIRVVGAPGIDGIRRNAWNSRRVRDALGLDAAKDKFAVLLLHPTENNDRLEASRTRMLLDAARVSFDGRIVALLPNSDPGSAGTVSALKAAARRDKIRLLDHAERHMFLGMMRDCSALIGNSSSGVIEAGSFGTPVLDVGPRQHGRERGPNVRHVEWNAAALRSAVRKTLLQRRTRRADNPYERGGAGRRIAAALAALTIDADVCRKVIRY